jgi:hypothetical protein
MILLAFDDINAQKARAPSGCPKVERTDLLRGLSQSGLAPGVVHGQRREQHQPFRAYQAGRRPAGDMVRASFCDRTEISPH